MKTKNKQIIIQIILKIELFHVLVSLDQNRIFIYFKFFNKKRKKNSNKYYMTFNWNVLI